MAKKTLEIIIGDKNLSSWSMRPWLVLHASGLPFKETKILLDRPNTEKLLTKLSPSKKVPVLIDGSVAIWDSLAICEYIAEKAPQKSLWPQDPHLRALARSYVAEMHSSFVSLRNQCSMDIGLRMQIKHLAPSTIEDIRRIVLLWKKAFAKNSGPYLFGEFGIVDAFYAPVVMRFISYNIVIKDKKINAYIKQILNHPAVRSWVNEAKRETHFKTQF